jgi:alpha-tubulin suppressor-like RCC1 family protein
VTIGTKTIINCVNFSITNANTCNPIEILQLSSVAKDFDGNLVQSVANSTALPAAANNTGRFYYLADICSYVVSDGSQWTTDMNSVGGESYIWSWGQGGSGQLGNNSAGTANSPVSVVGGFTDWCQVSAGGDHSLGVRTNGTAWAWGLGCCGRLGDGTGTNRLSPVSVIGGFTDWCQVSAGIDHSLGVRINGTAWAWGRSQIGEIGDDGPAGALQVRNSPVSVVGGFTDWCQVSAGGNFSLGVRTNGTVWSWGNGTNGILGNNLTISRSSPVSVVGGFTDWCQVSAGSQHSLAVRTNGTVWGWGCNRFGRLGDNTVTNKSSPVSVVGGFTDWCQVSAGVCHSLGIRTNGTAWSWGYNNCGQLGDNSTIDRSSPVSVVGGFTDWCQISGGQLHSIGLRNNGTAWSWGWGANSQLGTNSTIDRSSPVSVVGGFTDWFKVSAGSLHNHAIRVNPKGFQ